MVDIISSLGAGSGIDTTSLVSSLVEAERMPQDERLNTRQEKLEAQISAYGTFKGALSEFQSILSPLANNDTFNARSVAFPDTDIITPNSLEAGAQTGTYQIEVEDVARSQSLAMGVVTSDRNEVLGLSGELTLQFGKWTYTGIDGDIPDSFAVNDDRSALNITIEESDSLATIAKKINDGDSGIQASVLKVDGQFQLMLTSPSGDDNAMQISVSDAGLSDFEFNATNYASVTETQQASDAKINVNGLTVYRESNEIDDVIDGFNFTLNKASIGDEITFSVESDTATAEQAIRDFVDAYNTLFETIKNLTGTTKDEENNTVRGPLSTDGTAKSILNQIRSMISQTVPGVEDGFTALTNVGIRTELDGTLSIDEDDFSGALNDNFDLVETLFARNATSDSNYVGVTAGSYSSGVVAGSYEIEITQDPSKGSITSNAIDTVALPDFDSGTDTFTTALDTTGGGYTFKIKVDGTESSTITLNGIYNDAEELRADLQTLINGDSKLSATGAKVDVEYDAATDSFTLTSREYGKNSKVSFSAASASMADLGFTAALSGTAGKDVKGTINGEEGFGSGNILLPALGSDAYGLNLTIQPGATSEGAFNINFSHGFAGAMNTQLADFLSNDGAIATREETMDGQLDDISDDRDSLDAKMEKYEARLTAQYLAMQQIISTLNTTGDSLDGILERLPFTAQK